MSGLISVSPSQLHHPLSQPPLLHQFLSQISLNLSLSESPILEPVLCPPIQGKKPELILPQGECQTSWVNILHRCQMVRCLVPGPQNWNFGTSELAGPDS